MRFAEDRHWSRHSSSSIERTGPKCWPPRWQFGKSVLCCRHRHLESRQSLPAEAASSMPNGGRCLASIGSIIEHCERRCSRPRRPPRRLGRHAPALARRLAKRSVNSVGRGTRWFRFIPAQFGMNAHHGHIAPASHNKTAEAASNTSIPQSHPPRLANHRRQFLAESEFFLAIFTIIVLSVRYTP